MAAGCCLSGTADPLPSSVPVAFRAVLTTEAAFAVFDVVYATLHDKYSIHGHGCCSPIVFLGSRPLKTASV
jgi:hypothetical protein